MRLVIEQSDFQRLSPETQRELLEALAGKELLSRRAAAKAPRLLWRRPMDLTPELAVRLIHGLSDTHRARLRALAEKGGRISQKELLAVNRDKDMRVLSHFQSVLSRRLRRFVDDPEKKLHLIGWDYDATQWDENQTTIVDGIYYVTPQTAEVLRDYFESGDSGERTRH